MSDVLLVITQKGFGVAAVLGDDDRLVGIVTDGDLRRHMQGLLDHTAGEVMTANPTTVSPHALAEEAVNIMNSRKITCLFALDPANPGKVAGILHIHDCLRAGIV
jgi:arabinose-5-phosphate isomerase